MRLTSMRVPNGTRGRAHPLRPFALPEREVVLPLPSDVEYCPRIEIGKLVLLRRTWRLEFENWQYQATEATPDWSLGLFVHLTRLRAELNMPERVFVKMDGEPKPIFVDFSNYLLLHAFYKRWREHQGRATLTEAYPDITDAWLKDEDGHYLCELRMGIY